MITAADVLLRLTVAFAVGGVASGVLYLYNRLTRRTVTVILTPEQRARLDALQRRTSAATENAVVLDALGLYDAMTEEALLGRQVGALAVDGTFHRRAIHVAPLPAQGNEDARRRERDFIWNPPPRT